MRQLEHIEAIERRLWGAADNLRANSNFASNEYFMPVMGLIFLRHAYSRYLEAKDTIVGNLPTRGGKTRPLTKEDFSQQGAILLQPEAQFDYLVELPESEDLGMAIPQAMESIEKDYTNLEGLLPKEEYQELDNEVLAQLLRTLNPDELKRVSGDVFGRIYEYFLTQFADQKAHDGGEFFTPISLVSLISNVLEPKAGTVLDPACGSGGMFVQSARIVEQQGQNPTEKLTFKGLEKNPTTLRLAKMNLAVHGLDGDIEKAITYYEDPHELVGKADYVMANPPFNVDEIDADKVEADPRLPFGLPGVNKKDKVSNGNYIWISYFYSYLNEKGRAGFVMSSQASSAGSSEAAVRQRLVQTGDVELMIAIETNFFYPRAVPCELWFLNRDKPEEYIENNRLRIQLLEQSAQMLYKEWFVRLRFPGHEQVKVVDGVPEGWERTTAFNVMDVLSGGTPKTKNPDYWGGNIPFFTPKDVSPSVYVLTTEKTLTEEGLRKCNSKLYQKDTVFIIARGTVGEINLAQKNMAMNQSCYALVAKAPINQQYLYFALVEGVEQFRSRAVGSVFGAVVRDTFKLIPFMIPESKLIHMFSAYASSVLQQIDVISRQTTKLEETRDLLLPRLMNGDIAV